MQLGELSKKEGSQKYSSLQTTMSATIMGHLHSSNPRKSLKANYPLCNCRLILNVPLSAWWGYKTFGPGFTPWMNIKMRNLKRDPVVSLLAEPSPIHLSD